MSWRVGVDLKRIYEGERPVCQCHNAEDAARIVAAVNADSDHDLSGVFGVLLNASQATIETLQKPGMMNGLNIRARRALDALQAFRRAAKP